MSLKTISNAFTSKAGRQLLIAQKHSPAILFGVGVVGVVATVVVASRATLKIESIMDEQDEVLAKIELAENIEGYTEQDKQRDVLLLKLKTAGRLAKLYSPALALGALSIGCLSGSHIILNRRSVALTAAYALVDQSFKEYRSRVIEEFGMDKDEEFRFGTVEREVTTETKAGLVKSTVKVVDPASKSLYTFLFDEVNSASYSKDWGYNQTFLAAQQIYANDRLQARGYLFLNDVLRSLGLELVPHGQLVGWLADPEKFGRTGDGFVSFGIFNNTREGGERFVNGYERAVRLDFNVDGNIWELIGKAAR
jgi:hypothetical protein